MASEKKLKTVLLACGGTGGHIFPAFSVAEEIRLRRPDVQIIYVCGKRDIEDQIFKIVHSEKVYSVHGAPFQGRKSLISPQFLIKLTQGFIGSLKIIWKEKPEIAVGFGGYFSFPVLLAAKLCGVKTMLHEQNVVPGKANKLMARFVDSVALSFGDTAKLLPKTHGARVTGNPIRRAIESYKKEEALRFFEFHPSRRTILVLGGSQGSESINNMFSRGILLLDSEDRKKIQILHLCGQADPVSLRGFYEANSVHSAVFSFFDRMDLAYSVADLAVGRAGATFLAEITSKNIPAILIPYPLADGHQLENAKTFVKDNPGVILEQKDMSAELLMELTLKGLSGLFNLPPKPLSRETLPTAREKLMKYILETAETT